MTPNPIRGDARLAFATASDGPVSIEIFDLSGRRVRHLLDGTPTPAGLHAVAFDGRDDRGARLGGGVYFYRIRTAGGSMAGRFAVAR